MFDRFREERLKEYEEAKKRGEVDEDIIPLLDFINSLPDFVTLSSCSGRVAVIDIEEKPEFGNKRGARFLGKWHVCVDVENVTKAAVKGRGTSWLIQYPPIIHISCRNLKRAADVLKIANESGFRRSGIISLRRFVVEIASLERMELPLAKGGEMLVDKDYLAFVVDLSNKKLMEGKKKLQRFESAFKHAENCYP